MGFKDFINEQLEDEAILEGAGNLKGLPTAFIKALTRGSGRGDSGTGLAGENSELKLFKASAKQKDVTAAIRSISGANYVPSADKSSQYSRRYSTAEIAADIAKKENAGVVIKINGEWSYFAFASDNKYTLMSPEGVSPTVKAIAQRGSRRNNWRTSYYDSKGLTATQLSDVIDFKEDNVEVYIVTADKNRIKNQLDREEQRRMERGYVPEYKKKALIKFLNSKSNNMLEDAHKDLEEQLDGIMKQIKDYYAGALSGKKFDESFDADAISKQLVNSIKSIKSIGYVVSRIIEDGTIKDDTWPSYGKEDTFSWKRFKELVSEMQKATEE